MLMLISTIRPNIRFDHRHPGKERLGLCIILSPFAKRVGRGLVFRTTMPVLIVHESSMLTSSSTPSIE